MSDYRFGDKYKLNIYPKEAIGYDGELDIDKVESVEIDWVDFVRKPDDKSRWYELFGTPERAARTMAGTCRDCCECVIVDIDGCDCSERCLMDSYDALLEWLKGDVE